MSICPHLFYQLIVISGKNRSFPIISSTVLNDVMGYVINGLIYVAINWVIDSVKDRAEDGLCN